MLSFCLYSKWNEEPPEDFKQQRGGSDLLFDENTSYCKAENGLKGYGLKSYQSESRGTG